MVASAQPFRPDQNFIPGTFDGTEFIGWVNGVTPTKTGIRLMVNVRWDDRDQVKSLWDAMGMPVVVKMSPWDEFEEARQDLIDD